MAMTSRLNSHFAKFFIISVRGVRSILMLGYCRHGWRLMMLDPGFCVFFPRSIIEPNKYILVSKKKRPRFWAIILVIVFQSQKNLFAFRPDTKKSRSRTARLSFKRLQKWLIGQTTTENSRSRKKNPKL